MRVPCPNRLAFTSVTEGPVQCDRGQGPSLGNGVEKLVQGRSTVQNRPIWWPILCLGPQDGQEFQREDKFQPLQPRLPILWP